MTRPLPLSAEGESDGFVPPTMAEAMFFAEVASPRSTRRSVAVCYAWMMALYFGKQKRGADVTDFWLPLHAAICARFGIPILKVDSIKKMAWEIYEATALSTREPQNG